MSLILRWVGKDHADVVGSTHCHAFRPSPKEIPEHVEDVKSDGRVTGDDFLIVEHDGQVIGTATSLSLQMWVRQSRLACQGVADVSVIKTHRRRKIEDQGVATRMMWETIRRARDRGQVVSALMPFRVSFYEHFGYGAIERRNIWTVPTSILPQGEFDGMRYYESSDEPTLAACRQQAVTQGQCDIERSASSWKQHFDRPFDGYVIVDRPEPAGPVQSYLHMNQVAENGQDVLRVTHRDAISPAAFRRQLHFLASLRDQYAAVRLTLPADLPLHYLLRESQLPHRPVNHPAAALRTVTRMQLKILDHLKFLVAVRTAEHLNGSIIVRVLEAEGHSVTLVLDFQHGRIDGRLTEDSPQITCRDTTWAAIACGELKLTDAIRVGLAESDLSDIPEPFIAGPVPFCDEYF